MAMEHELASQGLQPPRSTFDHFIVNLRWTDRLHIEPVRGIADWRKLHGTVLGESRIKLARAWLSGPADRAAMQVVGVDDLGAADHAELRRIADVGAGNCRGRIAEGIGPIALRFIGKPDQVRL